MADTYRVEVSMKKPFVVTDKFPRKPTRCKVLESFVEMLDRDGSLVQVKVEKVNRE